MLRQVLQSVNSRLIRQHYTKDKGEQYTIKITRTYIICAILDSAIFKAHLRPIMFFKSQSILGAGFEFQVHS